MKQIRSIVVFIPIKMLKIY